MSVPAFDDIPKDMNKLISEHIKLYLTDPAAAHLWDARPVGLPGEVPTLLLTTIGRKSGEPRHVPLLYVAYGDGWIVVGSKGGNVDHPLWYRNLEANPECEVRVGAPPVKARARVLEGEERAEAWDMISKLYPETYPKYQARTARELPVVALEPIKG